MPPAAETTRKLWGPPPWPEALKAESAIPDCASGPASKKVVSSWPLKLAKGRHVVKLNLNRRPRAGWYVLRLRLADQDGNGAVLNRNVHVVYKKK